jgi:hypothetical protein
MKSAKLFIKVLTILSFMLFIILFLFYRTGRFDTFIGNKNLLLNNTNEINKIDTLIPKKDSGQKLMFPSSKSIILSKDNSSFADSLRKKYRQPASQRKQRELMMSSSKSGVIVKPIPFKMNDSLRLGTLKYKHPEKK